MNAKITNFKGILPTIAERAKTLFFVSKAFVVKNAPEVLIATGLAGFATTIGFSINGAINATIDMVNNDEPRFRDKTTKEKVKHTFKYYTPAIITGAGSTACIIFSNRVSSARNAAITSAYLLSEKAANLYKEELEKVTNEQQFKQIDTNVHRQVSDAYRDGQNEPKQTKIAFADRNTKIRCKDIVTHQQWYMSYNQLERTENDINFRLLDEGQITLNEILDMFDLEHSLEGDNYVWDASWQGKFKLWLEPHIDTELGDVWIEVDFGELRINK